MVENSDVEKDNNDLLFEKGNKSNYGYKFIRDITKTIGVIYYLILMLDYKHSIIWGYNDIYLGL